MVTYFGNKFPKCCKMLSSTKTFFIICLYTYIKVKRLTMNGKRQKVGHDDLIYS